MRFILILVLVICLSGCGKTEAQKKQDYIVQNFYEMFTQYNVVEDGIYIVSANEKFGLVNSHDGTVYAEVEYEKMEKLNNNDVLASKNGQYVIMSKHGDIKTVIGEYENIRSYYKNDELRLLTYNGGYYTLLDKEGQLITDFGQFDHLSLDTKHNDRFVIQRGTLYTIINEQGNQITNLGRYDGLIPDFDNGKFIGIKGDKKGIINDSGVTVVQFSYDDIWKSGKNGLYILNKNHKFGVANLDCKIIMPVDFSGIEGYETVFITKYGELYGIYDLHGNELLPCQYEKPTQIVSNAKEFSCYVLKDGQTYKITYDGEKFNKGI